MTREELDALLDPLFQEISEINTRNGFRPSGRPPEDVARFDEVFAEIDRLQDEFEAEHPVPPCPECGTARSAILGAETCLNIGQCRLAPSFLGG